MELDRSGCPWHVTAYFTKQANWSCSRLVHRISETLTKPAPTPSFLMPFSATKKRPVLKDHPKGFTGYTCSTCAHTSSAATHEKGHISKRSQQGGERIPPLQEPWQLRSPAFTVPLLPEHWKPMRSFSCPPRAGIHQAVRGACPKWFAVRACYQIPALIYPRTR